MTARWTKKGISEILFARKYAYDILRRFFIEEPSKEYLQIFARRKMYADFPFAFYSQEISNGVTDIFNYFHKHNPVHNLKDFENLHWDYTRMLIGPYELTAPPWESVYVRDDRLLFQKTTHKVRKKYRKYGFTAKELSLEAEDHIGLELDFMYHLNNFTLEFSGKEDKKSKQEAKNLLSEQLSFLHNHLLAFAPKFADNVVKNANTQFYRGMAKVLKGFLTMDSKVLSELLDIDKSH